MSDDKGRSKLISNLVITTIVLTVVTALLMFLGLTYVVTMIVMGTLPSIVANVVEKRKKRFASKTITAFNLAGLMPQIFSLARAGDPNSAAQGMLTNPNVWLVIYLLAGFGWVIVHIIPQITLLFLLVKAEFTIGKLRGLQKKLVEEWGEEVKRG